MEFYPIIFSFHFPLLDPEALHAENYTELPNSVGISFINKKAPVKNQSFLKN